MKAIIKLEAIGDNLRRLSEEMMKGNATAGRFVGRLRGRMFREAILPRRPWVAKILGRDERYGLARQFVKRQVDYSESNSTGSRGVYYYYHLDEGIYEVNELVSWNNERRYFLRSGSGEVTEISKEEVEQWLNDR